MDIEWDERYSVDDEELDMHHKGLFYLLSLIRSRCSGVNDSEYNSYYITQLEHFSNTHFRLERILMLDNGYMGMMRHIAEHDEFTKQVARMRSEFSDGDESHQNELIDFISKWLLHHVIIEDANLKPFGRDKVGGRREFDHGT